MRGIRLVLTIDASAMAAILVLQSNRIGYFDPELDASFRCLAKFGRYWTQHAAVGVGDIDRC